MADLGIYFKNADFSNIAHLREILEYDKHTRIEGLCSEAVFITDIVKEAVGRITTGYWVRKVGDGYHFYRLLTSVDSRLNSIDLIVMERLAGLPHPCCLMLVYFHDADGKFYAIRYKKGMQHPLAERGIRMTPPCSADKHEKSNEEAKRLMLASDYLERNKLLKAAAISRVFANCYLGNGYVIDMDVLLLTPSGEVGVIEVKQKFPFGGGRYGINEGQVNFFGYLQRNGIPVVHVILKKPWSNGHAADLPAVDLLEHPEKYAPFGWIAARLDMDKLHLEEKPAPEKTSIGENKTMKYYSILEAAFQPLKNYRGSDPDAWNKLLLLFP